MRRTILWLLLGSSNHAALHGGCGAARLAPFVLPLQPFHAQLLKTALPLRYRRRASAQCVFNLAVGLAFGQRQNQPRAKHVSSRQATRLRPTLQLFALLAGDDKQSLIIGHIIETLRSHCMYHWDGTLVTTRASNTTGPR